MKAREITYKGVTKTSPEWAREYGIKPEQLNSRLNEGWDFERALLTPICSQEPARYEYKGKMYTTVEIAAMHGNISRSSVLQRLQKGMTVEEVLATPNTRPKRKMAITARKQKEMIPPAKQKKERDVTQCRTCRHHGTFSGGGVNGIYCDYSETSEDGRCRLFISPPSPNCTVYEKGKSIVREMTLKRIAGKR